MANPTTDPFARLVEGLLAETYGAKILSVYGNAPQGAVTASVTIRWDGTQSGGEETAAAAYIAAFDWNWVPPAGTLHIYSGSGLGQAFFFPGATNAALLSDETATAGVKWAFVAGTSTPPPGNIDPSHWIKHDEFAGTTLGDSGTSASPFTMALLADANMWGNNGLPAQMGGNVSYLHISPTFGTQGSSDWSGDLFDDDDQAAGPFTLLGRYRPHCKGDDTVQHWLIGSLDPEPIRVRVDGRASGVDNLLRIQWGENAFFTTVDAALALDTLEQWYAWAVRRNDDGSIDVFVDKVNVAQIAAVDAPPDPVRIGSLGVGDPRPYFTGCGLSAGFDQDDLQFYTQALTDEQIANITDGEYVGAAGPLNTVPANFSMDQDTTHTFSGTISVLNTTGVTLTCTHGTMSLAATTGLTFTTNDGTDDASMVFSGLEVDLVFALDGMTFTPTPGFAGTATLTIISTNASGQADSDTLTVTVGPAYLLIDNFTDTNSTAITSHTPDSVTGGATWSQTASEWTIQSNKLKKTGSGGWAHCSINLGATTGTIECDVTTPATGLFALGVCARMNTSTQNIGARISNDSTGAQLMVEVGGSESILVGITGISFAANTTYHIKLTVVGNVLTVYVDSVQRAQATNATYSSNTRWGFAGYTDGSSYQPCTVDNVTVV